MIENKNTQFILEANRLNDIYNKQLSTSQIISPPSLNILLVLPGYGKLLD